MKRYILLVVCLVLILSCVGCFQEHLEVDNNEIFIGEPKATQEPVEPTLDVKGTKEPRPTPSDDA